MAKQIINIGQAANDRSGDPLRTAFEKTNANFTELYSAIGADVQIPVQTNNGGKYLTTNGTTLSWATVTQGGSSDRLVNSAYSIVVESTGALRANVQAIVSDNQLALEGDGLMQMQVLDGPYISLFNQGATKEINLVAHNGIDLSPTWTFDTRGKLTLPAGTTYEYVNVPLTGHGNGLARLDFTLVTDGVETQWAAASANPAGSGYSEGDTFTFDEEFLGIPGASVTIEVLTVGPGGSVENLAFTQPPLYPADIYRDSPINLQVGAESNRWTFGASGDLTVPGGIKFPNALSIKDSIIGYTSSETITEEDPAGITSQTTTEQSRIELDPTGIVIARRTIEVVDDGVITATNIIGSVLQLDSLGATIKQYVDPPGPYNNEYSQFTTVGGAIIESGGEDVNGPAYGRVNARGNSVEMFAKSFAGTEKRWLFNNDGTLLLPYSGRVFKEAPGYLQLAEFETIYNDSEAVYQDTLTAWMDEFTFKPVWFALPGRLAYDELMAWIPTTGQPTLPLNIPPVAKVAQDSYAAWQEAIAASKLTVQSETAIFAFESTGKLKLAEGGTVGGGDQAAIQAAYDLWQSDEADWQYLITSGGSDTNIRPWNFAGPSRAEKQAVVLSMWQAQHSGDTLDWVPISQAFYNEVRAWLAVTANQDGYDIWKKLTTSVAITADDNTWTFTNDGGLALPSAGKITNGVDTAQVGSSLVIETGSAYGDTAVSIASDPTLATTYPAGSTITFQDGDVRTITSYDNYPGGTDIFWDTSKTGTLFPITLKTSNYVPATTLQQWTFTNDGNLTLPAGGDIVDSTGASALGKLSLQAKPTTKEGQAGDKKGMTAIDSVGGDFYYCINDYTDGVSAIWAKVTGSTAWI